MIGKKILGTILCAAIAFTALTGCAGGGTKKVGISMPTQDLQRWNQDGAYMEEKFKAAGYEVDLKYAGNKADVQLSQVEDMINTGCKVIIIAAVEASSLGQALDKAAKKKIPVIAYDRLLMSNENVSYYATFDNYKVGQIQGEFVRDALQLDSTSGPYNIEFTAGDPGDNNAGVFFQGAMDVLKPYLDSGKLVCVSGQTDFDSVATPEWSTATAQSRAENIISSYYADGTVIDAWLCSNDSTAQGVVNAIDKLYDVSGGYPIVTGQDCDIVSVKNMIAGKQTMSVFKDTRTLAERTVTMATQILDGATVETNNTYDNNKKQVPSYLCDPVFADKDSIQKILIDSGYYSAEELGL
jgi:putative multiple sugar transport system substrate-binding protein